jgi:hypothetical protein
MPFVEKKGSAIRDRISGSIPVPVSAMIIRTPASPFSRFVDSRHLSHRTPPCFHAIYGVSNDIENDLAKFPFMTEQRFRTTSVVAPLLVPFVKVLSTPKRAARVIVDILNQNTGATEVYYDEGGYLMQGSAQVRDPEFQDRVVAETRAFLATGV